MWHTMNDAPRSTPVLVAIPSAVAKGGWLVGEAYYREDEDEPYAAGWWWANTGPHEHGVSSLAENGYVPVLWCHLPTPDLTT